MAQLVLNGGERKNRFRIIAEQPQEVVVAYRKLERIKRELERFQQEFASTPESVEKLEERSLDCTSLKSAYAEALKSCTKSLEREINEMPEEKRQYYFPVMLFLSRASNSHTILPFEKYFTTYLNELRFKANRGISVLDEMPFIGGMHTLRGFVEERIAESIKTCEAYCTLLSNSLGSYHRFFSLSEMLTTISLVIREVSIHKTGGMLMNLGSLGKIRDQHKKGLRLDLDPVGEILGIPPLAYFLIHQVISNAFKASFTAYTEQRLYGNSKLPADMPELPKPRVDISLTRVDSEFIRVMITDNGIGVPQGELGRLFGDPSQRLHTFIHFTPSNGSSTVLFPFMADLIGVDMAFTSDGIGKGLSAELLFPVDLAMRTSRFAESK
jgi:signal transduction histidine kinase